MLLNEKEIDIVTGFGSYDEASKHLRDMRFYMAYYLNTIDELAKKYGFETDELHIEANLKANRIICNCIHDHSVMDTRYNTLKQQHETFKNRSLKQKISDLFKKN